MHEQQEYFNQISLMHKKVKHLEETLKIEEEESQLVEKINFHRENSVREAELAARKREEDTSQELQLREEEANRNIIITNMVRDPDNSL